MKTKKIKKVLKLNKTTIARLNESEAREVKGGVNRTNTCPWNTCKDICN